MDPKNLVKSSYQMHSVYKYYENPAMLVKSKHHIPDNDEFVEVRELVPKIKFFDAPVKPADVPQPIVESESSTLPPPPVVVD